MQLPPEQTARFYRIWLALLHYVNEQQYLVPAFPASEERNGLLPLADELRLRNALWADDGLRERFISANPAGLSSADLAVVASWRYRRAGSFYIVRALKKYTVFLSEDIPPRAYGVLGLSTPIEELARGPLPVLAQTVLLPFEGRIIYDGLLQWYAVVFGPGVRSRLNAEYRNAQEREGVITTLEPANLPADPQERRTAVLARNTKIVQAFRKDLSSKGLSPKTVEQHVERLRTLPGPPCWRMIPHGDCSTPGLRMCRAICTRMETRPSRRVSSALSASCKRRSAWTTNKQKSCTSGLSRHRPSGSLPLETYRYAACSTRRRSRSKLARPYICRLRLFNLFT